MPIQSTSVVIPFKAFLSSDHVTEATGKTIAITISKNGGAFGNPNAGATNATEISSGWYKVTLDSTDTNTVGYVAIRGAAATIDDVGDRIEIIAQYATPTNITAGTITTVATATNLTNLPSIPANWITAAGINAGAITAAKFATDAIDSNALAASAVTEIQSGLATPTNITAGTITTVTNLTNAPTNGDLTATMKASVTAAVPTASANATAVLAGVVEGTTTVQQSLRLANSANGGKADGMATTTAHLRDLADSKNRVTATVDASGNRTAITLDLT